MLMLYRKICNMSVYGDATSKVMLENFIRQFYELRLSLGDPSRVDRTGRYVYVLATAHALLQFLGY